MKQKICKKCGEEKEIESFYKCKTNKDGREGKCIACRNSESNKNYMENADAVCNRSSEWYNKNKDRKLKTSAEWFSKNKDRKRETGKKWRERNIDRARKIDRENMNIYRSRHPEKDAARHQVFEAIRKCLLHRMPCEVCHSTISVEAHHDDYSKPLDVRWLCKNHHTELHTGK